MSSPVSDLEPVRDFYGARPWFADAPVTAALRPGPHTAALYSSRFARTWCDGCGRRRGADGRCPSCDPWWTSPFYVYGSLLTVGVTALLLAVLPLLRSSSPIASDSASVAVLSAPTSFGSGGLPIAPVLAPSVVLQPRPMSAYVAPAMRPAPVVLPPAPTDAGLADLARLRAMTDYAAGMETRRDASRAWSGIAPMSIASFPVVQYAPFTRSGRSETAASTPPATAVGAPAAAMSAPFPTSTETAGGLGEAGTPPDDNASGTPAPQRTL